jgi:hypothetical protein
LRTHILSSRLRVRVFRQHSDFWMLRFFSFRLSRWDEIRNILKLGLPKVEAR